MQKLTSRKLVGIVVGMLSIVGVVLGSAVIGNVDKEIVLATIVALGGVTGYFVQKQSELDQFS